MCLKQEMRVLSAKFDLDLVVNCLICSNLMQEPTTMHCGHSFCRACTVKWCIEYRHFTCPVCRQPLDHTLPGVNLTLKALIDYLKQPSTASSSPSDLQLQVEQYNNTDKTEVGRAVRQLVDHKKLIGKITSRLNPEIRRDLWAPKTGDSTLSRLNIFNMPVYLWLTFWGFFVLCFIGMFRRFLK